MVNLRDQTILALRQEVAEWHGQAQALQAELEAARAERDNALALVTSISVERGELVALLREVEWSCRICYRDREDGHAPDCRLHAALEGGA